jgi:inner membrane protein
MRNLQSAIALSAKGIHPWYKAGMDNIAHTLFGATLGKAGLEKKTAYAMPALVIAANLPDIDIFLTRSQSYLDRHRGITHSFVGMVGLSFLLAGAIWAAGRLRLIAGRRQIRFFALWFVSAIGILSHLFLDVLGDYGLRPLLPFSSKRYYGDLINVVDPWVWLIFGCSLFLAARMKSSRLAWVALACVLDAAIFFASGKVFALGWTLVVLAVTGAMSALERQGGIRPSRAAILLFLAYLGLAGAEHHAMLRRAWQAGPSLVSDTIWNVSVLPGRPGTVGKWTVVLEGPDNYYVADTGLQNWRGHPPKFETYPKNLQDACYREALTQPQMASLARFARFPSVEVKVSGDLCHVLFRDLRYARGGASGWAVATATVPLNWRGRSTASGHP